jgi:nitrogen regulatory protein PII
MEKELLNNQEVELSLIAAIVNRGEADKVIEAAKKAGAPGATAFFARGAGVKEAHTFLGLTIDSAREIILFIVMDSIVATVMDAIHNSGSFDKHGSGIAFSLKITGTTGLADRVFK